VQQCLNAGEDVNKADAEVCVTPSTWEEEGGSWGEGVQDVLHCTKKGACLETAHHSRWHTH
jgi:hypothetical protein